MKFLTSLPLQFTPSPSYPILQRHWKLPTMFEQFAKLWQLSVFKAHSLISKKTNENDIMILIEKQMVGVPKS